MDYSFGFVNKFCKINLNTDIFRNKKPTYKIENKRISSTRNIQATKQIEQIHLANNTKKIRVIRYWHLQSSKNYIIY